MTPKEMVQVPAIGLIVVGSLATAVNVLFAVIMVLGASLGSLSSNMNGQMGNFAQGAIGVAMYGFFTLLAITMVVGGIKMKNLSSFPMAMAGCIIGILPCYHSCCILGLPFGVWGLVMLFKPEVQSAFKFVKDGGDPDQIPFFTPPGDVPPNPPNPPSPPNPQ